MIPCNVYTSHPDSGSTSDVVSSQLSAAFQLQQHYSNTSAPTSLVMEPKYSIDVPISASDVDRWNMSMMDTLRNIASAAPIGLSEDLLEGAHSSQSASSSSSSFLPSPLQCRFVPFFLPGEVLGMGPPEKQREAVHPLAPIPLLKPNARPESVKSVSQILQHRRKWLPHRQRFPVYQQRMDLLDALCQHLVVAIVGGPQTGKTLQLPQILSESEAFKGARILLVVSNEISVRLTVWRLREELGDTNADSSTIGYVSSFEVCCHAHTRIVVITADILLRQLLCDPTLVGVRAVIIDDVHLRSERTELCFGLLRDLLVEVAGLQLAWGLPVVSSSISSFRLIVNCADNESAKQITEYFSVVPCHTFPLHNMSSSSHLLSVLSETHLVAQLPTAVNPVIFYLDETVQWLNKCTSEHRSAFWQLSEEDLVSYMGKVEVITQLMAVSEADFLDQVKCRQHWCGLMKDALLHFDRADREWIRQQEVEQNTRSSSSLSIIIVSIPETEYAARIIDEELQMFIRDSAKRSSDNKDEPRETNFELHNVFSYDDMAFTLYHKTIATLSGSCAPVETSENDQSSTAIPTRHILLGPSELLESLLPPTLNVGLIIDFARQCTCLFNIETAADHWSTEYVSSTVLQHRRRILLTSSSDNRHNDFRTPLSQGEEEGKQGASSLAPLLRPPPLVIHLIPKSLLHSAQRRRQHHDTGHHSVFRLSSTQYLQLYQILQLREDIAIAAAIRCGTANALLLENGSGVGGLGNHRSTPAITEKIGTVFSQYFIGVPAPTSSKYEQIKRIFLQLEIYLRASGHLLSSSKSISAPLASTHFSSALAAVQPLGILSACWLFPIPITRLLVFGSIFDRPLEATAVAAIWLGGDAFEPHLKKLRRKKNPVALGTSEAIVLEARNFFGKEGSDISALYSLYKMWLDQRSAGVEQEEAFISECQADQLTLERIHYYHGQLMLFLLRTGMIKGTSFQWSSEQLNYNGSINIQLLLDHIAKHIIELPDSAFMDDPVQMIVSASVYPHCGLPNASGTIKLYEGFNVSGTRTQRVGVFSKSCIMHQKEILQKLQERPITYLSRVMVTSLKEQPHLSSSVGITSVSILHQGFMLHFPASLLFCGEEKEKAVEAPSRCRGWSSVLTSSWRKTRRARILPPAAKLLPVSIPLQSFDMTGSTKVLVSLDGQLQFVMRATVSQWLRQLRLYIQRSLRVLITNPCREDAMEDLLQAFHCQREEVVEAWNWWCRRKASAAEWLREERQKYANIRKTTEAMEEEENNGGGGGGVTGAVHRLYPFYAFYTEPGVPPPVQPPQKKVQSAIEARTEYDGDRALGEDGNKEPDVYRGKLPSADVDSVIRYCVTAIAQSGSRKAENKLLKDNPESFSFLEPSNELHEYYLFLLKKAAPNIETLGDDIEGLIVFLNELEAELREEQGLPPLETLATGAEQGQRQEVGETEGNGLLRVEDVENDEDDEGFKGIQEEEAFSLRKNIVARAIHHPPTPSATENPPLSSDQSSPSPDVPPRLPCATGMPLDPTEPPQGDPSDQELVGTGASYASSSPTQTAQPTSQADSRTDASRAKELLSLIDGPLGTDGFFTSSSDGSEGGPLRPTASELAALVGESEDGKSTLPVDAEKAALALCRPPPPLPAAMVESSVPSVLVYPLPYSSSCKRSDVPKELCKALGKQLRLNVGPVVIVGKIARITVPNKNVERRCITLGFFQCLGKVVYLLRNDRIIENPQKEVIGATPPPSFLTPMGGPGMLLPPQHGGMPYMPQPPSTTNNMMHPSSFMQPPLPGFHHPMFSSGPGMGYNYAPPSSQASPGPPYALPHPSMMGPPLGFFPDSNSLGPQPPGSLPLGSSSLATPFAVPPQQNMMHSGGNFPESLAHQQPAQMSSLGGETLPFFPTLEETGSGSPEQANELGNTGSSLLPVRLENGASEYPDDSGA